ncbi:Helix-turn-helix [Roseivivax halotolerans]|uniref:Helix-turn-helix n=1 Tax=Roseivivax halotolerans TaxID=93684 RepID=A0A1I5X5G1_9RHOB|nr:helix-turn-helix transcriptional regulator [Roseivivax halotolerans]SFQ27168.1 Helix-turn-helix [Roseivivax halotolerans]
MTDPSPSAGKNRSKTKPSELRLQFGQNLRKLSAKAESISGLCRELGINRTQYNRYLNGESFPRPDVLHRICSYFDLDARIVLEPLEEVEDARKRRVAGAELSQFIGGIAAISPSETEFPNGFFRYSRRSFVSDTRFVTGLVMVYREYGQAFIRGYEDRRMMKSQGLSLSRFTREFRGTIFPQANGIVALVSRRNAQNLSFNFLTRVPSFANNYWVGFSNRSVSEAEAGRIMERVVFEHLGTRISDALRVARKTGLHDAEGLPEYHRELLRIGAPMG